MNLKQAYNKSPYRLWLRSPSRLRLRCFRCDGSLSRSRSLSLLSLSLLLLLLRLLDESPLSLDRSRRRSCRLSSSEGDRVLSRPINDGGWAGSVSVGICGSACSPLLLVLATKAHGSSSLQSAASEYCPLAHETTMRWHPRMIQLHRQLRTQARYAYSQEEESGMSYVQKSGIPTPRQVKQRPHLRGEKL